MGLATLLGLLGQQSIADTNFTPGPPAGSPQYESQIPQPVSPQHRGIFGIHGTARDIMGTLGDALLVSEGINPIYRETRRGEQISDTMQGYGTDPIGTIGKISGLDREYADNLYNRYLAEQKANAEGSDKRFEREGKIRANAGDLVASVDPKNPKSWPYVRQLIQRRFAAADMPIELPEEFDPEIANTMIADSLSAKERAQLQESQNYHDASIALESGRLQANTALQAGQLIQRGISNDETARHNRRTEDISQQRANQAGEDDDISIPTDPSNYRKSRNRDDKITDPKGGKWRGDGSGGWIKVN